MTSRLTDVLTRTPADRRARATAPPATGDPGGTGFTAEPHRPSSARLGRGLLYAVLLLWLASGFWQTVGAPIARALSGPPPPPPAPVAGIDHGAAARVATGYTADFLSWNDDAAERNAASIDQWTAPNMPVTTWTGAGAFYTDIVTTGHIVDDGPDRVIVQTTARVSMPGPARLTWITLAVVIERDGNGLHVTNAVFHGDTPVALHLPADEIDSRLSVDTADTAQALLAALATGDTGYITTPRVQLAGLSGVVELADLSNWTVVHSDGDTRYGTATVLWQLPGSNLQVQQSLALRITNVEGRWLLDSYGPALEG